MIAPAPSRLERHVSASRLSWMPSVGRLRAPPDTIAWLDPWPDQPRGEVAMAHVSALRCRVRVGDPCPSGRSDTVINPAPNRRARSIARPPCRVGTVDWSSVVVLVLRLPANVLWVSGANCRQNAVPPTPWRAGRTRLAHIIPAVPADGKLFRQNDRSHLNDTGRPKLARAP
jgi:hypothetical protein